MDTLTHLSPVAGAIGYHTVTADIVPHDNVGNILKVVIAVVSLLPSLFALFKKKPAA